jgi:NAD-dependent SIR2 family protein deacetylase
VEVAEFLRIHSMRAAQLSWFLGAGASAAAGIPTATEMMWTFKRLLYCSEQRRPFSFCSDLGDPAVQQRLQRYFDDKGTYPALWADDEYSAYFEAAYGRETDRRRFIEDSVRDARPSYGHRALAALMATGRARVVWTTNFDRLIEDAASVALSGTARLVVASPDTADIATNALAEDRWPIYAKLHGDFQSQRLRNTTEELRRQDARLRAALLDACLRCGLVVTGFSGRDNSVMEALEAGLHEGRGYPHGLFWLARAGAPVVPRVQQLMRRAADAGVEGHIVKISTFDEIMADIVRLLPQMPEQLARTLTEQRSYRSAAPRIRARRGYPVLRLNALRIDPAPVSCRRIECDIGGSAEVRRAVADAGDAITAARSSAGVLAFGSDGQVRRTFERYGIRRVDLHQINPQRLRKESTDHGLVQEALARAIGRERPLLVQRRRRSYVARVNPAMADDQRLGLLTDVADAIVGRLPSGLEWAEAVRLRVEFRLGSLWLLFEPSVWVASTTVAEHQEAAGDFIRSRLAGRYNSVANRLFETWAMLLAGGPDGSEVRTFGIADGVDGVFFVRATTAFAEPSADAPAATGGSNRNRQQDRRRSR